MLLIPDTLSFQISGLQNQKGAAAVMESVHKVLPTFRPSAFDGTDHDTGEQLTLFRYKLMAQASKAQCTLWLNRQLCLWK
jgi:hypothetical protein